MTTAPLVYDCLLGLQLTAQGYAFQSKGAMPPPPEAAAAAALIVKWAADFLNQVQIDFCNAQFLIYYEGFANLYNKP